MQYLVGDYYATGEGRTIMILITKAYPRQEDYATESKFENGKFTPGILKEGMTERVRAIREFADQFGPYMAQGVQVLPQVDFLAKWGHMIPEAVKKNIGSDAGNFNFSCSFHLNFS